MTTATTRPSRDERAPLAVVRIDREGREDLNDANEAWRSTVATTPSLTTPSSGVRAHFDSRKVSKGDPSELIGEREGRFEDGVPIGVVTAVASERGLTIGETSATIRDRRMAGELYEPRNDHLRVT